MSYMAERVVGTGSFGVVYQVSLQGLCSFWSIVKGLFWPGLLIQFIDSED